MNKLTASLIVLLAFAAFAPVASADPRLLIDNKLGAEKVVPPDDFRTAQVTCRRGYRATGAGVISGAVIPLADATENGRDWIALGFNPSSTDSLELSVQVTCVKGAGGFDVDPAATALRATASGEGDVRARFADAKRRFSKGAILR